jgi:hypothetical protein
MPLKNIFNELNNISKRDILLSLIKIYSKEDELKRAENKNKINIIKIFMNICIFDNDAIKIYFSTNILSNLILKEFFLKKENIDTNINFDLQNEILLLISEFTNIIKTNRILKNELNQTYKEEIERFIILERKNKDSNLVLPLKSFLSHLLDKN